VNLITNPAQYFLDFSGSLMARIRHMTTGKNLTIAIYSDDSSVRSSIITALGRRVSAELAEHKIVEFATGPALRLFLDSKQKVDLFILDGEAVPEGGMGLARQLKDELFNCPPVLVITGRIQDNWLAAWSKADDAILHPIDPFILASKVAALLQDKSIISA
jgi:DNA-binding response OmpR family regulator